MTIRPDGVKLAVFDCDGTLSDGQAAVVNAMHAAFAETGLPAPSAHAVRRIVGLSLPNAVRQLVPDAAPDLVAATVDAYKSAFFAARQAGSVHEPLFDGMHDLLHRLHAAGWMLGVATGKSDRGLTSTLAMHGLTDLFATTHTADRHPSKPHPAMLEAAMADVLAEPAQTVMIGDTVFDIDMARAAGVRAVGVAWGYHEAGELLGAGAVGVAQTMQELEEMIHG